MHTPEKPLPGKVFILEDDFDYADLISREFSALGFEVEVCHSLSQAKKLLSDKKFDLYIIDRLLPDGDGITLVKELKEADPRLLIIMISVRKEEADRVLGLSLGADDYLPKPFNPRELVLRADWGIFFLCAAFNLGFAFWNFSLYLFYGVSPEADPRSLCPKTGWASACRGADKLSTS